MARFISPPVKIPLLLKWGIMLSEKITKKTLLPARILAWYPKAAFGSALLESLVIHKPGRMEPRLTRRLLKLVRMQVSFLASCPFCIDMNSALLHEEHISQEEILVLQGVKAIQEVKTFDEGERFALEYARGATATPIQFTTTLVDAIKTYFSPRELVILASTIAQVNYWTRLIQAFGISPAGFSDSRECALLQLDKYKTIKEKDS
jgi:alkylhydroperoxidase family enzyme